MLVAKSYGILAAFLFSIYIVYPIAVALELIPAEVPSKIHIPGRSYRWTHPISGHMLLVTVQPASRLLVLNMRNACVVAQYRAGPIQEAP